MHLLIAAAGSGRRMGANGNKLLLQLSGRPLLAWTLDAASQADSIEWIGIIGQQLDYEAIMKITSGIKKPIKWVEGGTTRQESVQKGLSALPEEATHVLIHDGARCLVKGDLFDRCSQTLLKGKAVIAATPVTDTIKRVSPEGLIMETPDRAELWAAQTPQGFSVRDLREAHSQAITKGWNVTDDASLYEILGWPVTVLDAGPSNIKVTTPFDLIVAEAVLTTRPTS